MRDTKPKPVLFRDDFSAGLGKWQPNWLGPNDQAITPPINVDHEVAAYDPAQVTIQHDGAGRPYLSLKAGKASTTDYHGKTWQYRSGCVTTRHTFTCIPPVRVEAHLWLPGDQRIDNWPAFWCDGTGTWPATGELDVMEGIEGDAEYHFHSPSTGAGGRGAILDRPNGIGWHRFAAEWRADSVEFFYDNTKVGTLTQGITSAPMYLILNLALSETISPPVVAPSEMRARLVEVTRLAA